MTIRADDLQVQLRNREGEVLSELALEDAELLLLELQIRCQRAREDRGEPGPMGDLAGRIAQAIRDQALLHGTHDIVWRGMGGNNQEEVDRATPNSFLNKLILRVLWGLS